MAKFFIDSIFYYWVQIIYRENFLTLLFFLANLQIYYKKVEVGYYCFHVFFPNVPTPRTCFFYQNLKILCLWEFQIHQKLPPEAEFQIPLFDRAFETSTKYMVSGIPKFS